MHSYGKRRSYIEREKHSNFQKWKEIKERKVDFLGQIEFLGGWYKYIKKKKRKDFPFFGTNLSFLGWYIYIRKDVGEQGFWDCLEEKHRGAGKDQVQPSLSRYVSCYSWNSYPYSISSYVRFLIFNILFIGVDGKGHKLFCWYWLLACLPRICLWSPPTNLSLLNEIWNVAFMGSSFFVVFILYTLFS